MNGEKLLDKLELADQKYIEEAEKKNIKALRSNRRKWTIAASLVLVIIAGLVVRKVYIDKCMSIPYKFDSFLEAELYIGSFNELEEGCERVVRLRIDRMLTPFEVDCFANQYYREAHTFYEATIMEDYSFNKTEEEHICIIGPSYEMPYYGDPVYAEGAEYVMMLCLPSGIKDNDNKYYWGPYAGMNAVFDLYNEDGTEYIYKRVGYGPFTHVNMEEGQAERITTCDFNPVTYSQKILLDEFIDYIKTESKFGSPNLDMKK